MELLFPSCESFEKLEGGMEEGSEDPFRSREEEGGASMEEGGREPDGVENEQEGGGGKEDGEKEDVGG